MPGKHVIGVFGDFRREDEGEYVCPRCSVFGLEKDEVRSLIELGFCLTDNNKEEDGYEVKCSIFKLMRTLGSKLGFAIEGNPVCTSAPGDRKTLVYTMTKEL